MKIELPGAIDWRDQYYKPQSDFLTNSGYLLLVLNHSGHELNRLFQNRLEDARLTHVDPFDISEDNAVAVLTQRTGQEIYSIAPDLVIDWEGNSLIDADGKELALFYPALHWVPRRILDVLGFGELQHETDIKERVDEALTVYRTMVLDAFQQSKKTHKGKPVHTELILSTRLFDEWKESIPLTRAQRIILSFNRIAYQFVHRLYDLAEHELETNGDVKLSFGLEDKHLGNDDDDSANSPGYLVALLAQDAAEQIYSIAPDLKVDEKTMSFVDTQKRSISIVSLLTTLNPQYDAKTKLLIGFETLKTWATWTSEEMVGAFVQSIRTFASMVAQDVDRLGQHHTDFTRVGASLVHEFQFRSRANAASNRKAGYSRPRHLRLLI